jgi:hypothetical protein
MIEYMVALTFAEMVGGCRISNISLPKWNIHHPKLELPYPNVVEPRQQHIDLPALARLVASNQINGVKWTGYGQRMENFLPRERYRDVFVSPFGRPMGYGPGYLVCPVRAEDILDGSCPEYPLTPVEFYRDLAKLTGLILVFIGQTRPNLYMDRLREAFPDALFREPQDDPLVDFETIRQSHNIALGVSTYSWLAAWLSSSAENIYLAVSGLFNPMQKPNVDLLPFGDARYKFFLFPLNYGVPLERHAEAHRRIAPFWQQMPHDELRRRFRNAPVFPRDLNQALALFDTDFYLQANPDVADIALRVGRDYARGHYIDHGFRELRLPFRLDEAWYASEYPLAAFEVARGNYAELAHQYMAVGKARGYLPYSPAAQGENESGQGNH